MQRFDGLGVSWLVVGRLLSLNRYANHIMNTFPKIIFWTLAFSSLVVTSCKKKQVDAVVEEPIEKAQEPEKLAVTIDSTDAMEKLTAKDRYWCIEEVTRTVGKNTKEISEDTLSFTREQVWYIHANAYRFSKYPTGGGKIEEFPQESVLIQHNSKPFEYSDGVSGKRPYGITELDVRFAWILIGSYNGRWNWDSSKQTFFIDFPIESPLVFWESKIGYLDPGSFPVYNNVAEAKAAGKPERIRIIMEVVNDKEGKVVYTYVLRAAWILEKVGGYYRTNSKYSVLY